MQKKYDEVPTIISCKDLDYLTDMFNWNYEAVKFANSSYVNVSDSELKDLFVDIRNVHLNNLSIIIDLLDEKGKIYESKRTITYYRHYYLSHHWNHDDWRHQNCQRIFS